MSRALQPRRNNDGATIPMPSREVLLLHTVENEFAVGGRPAKHEMQIAVVDAATWAADPIPGYRVIVEGAGLVLAFQSWLTGGDPRPKPPAYPRLARFVRG